MKITSVLLVLMMMVGNACCQGHSNGLLVGTSKVNITPSQAVAMAGYPHARISESIHDSLYCRVTAFKLHEKTMVLISTDLIGTYTTYEFFRDSLLKKFEVKCR